MARVPRSSCILPRASSSRTRLVRRGPAPVLARVGPLRVGLRPQRGRRRRRGHRRSRRSRPGSELTEVAARSGMRELWSGRGSRRPPRRAGRPRGSPAARRRHRQSRALSLLRTGRTGLDARHRQRSGDLARSSRASTTTRAVAGPVEMPHGPWPAATQSPSWPRSSPTSGRPSSDCGRGHARAPTTFARASAGTKRSPARRSGPAQAAGSGRLGEEGRADGDLAVGRPRG